MCCASEKKKLLIIQYKMLVWRGLLNRHCKVLHLLVATILFCCVLYPVGAARKVRVGIYQNPPKVFTTEDGLPVGIFIDVINYVAEREKWELEFVDGSWMEGLKRLENGEIELMPDVAYTADRARHFSFHTRPVISSWFQVYARQGSGIKSLLDLDGKKVVVLEGSVQQTSFEAMAQSFHLKITLIGVPDYQTVFQKVADKEADAAVTNQFFGNMNARKYGLEDTAIIFSPSSLHFATAFGKNLFLLKKIDEHLQTLKQDTKSLYYQSLKRWTSENVRFQIPQELKIIGMVVLGFLFLSLAGSLLLKQQVNARTIELQQSHAELEQRVLDRTVELAAAMERAEAADKIKSAFLASMSHELRTPLNSIIGFTGILLQGLAGPLNPEQNKQLGMVQKSARHLLSLINDVLDISKIEAGQLELSLSAFDLRPSLEKVVMLLTPLAKEKGLELQSTIAENVGVVTADQRRIEQIVINVINNAVKFTEKGLVRLSCRIEDGKCRIEVADTGIGMKAESLATIFEPFRQIDSGLARKHEGTGLGLSICRKLLLMMGGSISVESELGHGSTFYISFPVIKGVDNV